MKTSKRIAGLILALVMVLTMAIPAFAAGEYTITIDNSVNGTPVTGHTYEAYQIFKGDLAESGGNVILSNIDWGTGIDGDALLAELKTTANANGDKIFENCKTAEDVAEVLHKRARDSEWAQIFAQVAGNNLATGSDAVAGTSNYDATTGLYTIAGLDAGYYLVKDQDTSISSGAHDSYTRFILEVVKDVTVKPKSSKPTVVKKVKDVNDSTGEATDWQDSADYDIKDEVSFRLTGTLPSTYADYKTYKYVFHDTLSTGLTYKGDATVTVVNGSNSADVTNSFDITHSNGVLTISCDDLKTIKDKDNKAVETSSSTIVVVDYKATLNEKAVIGSAGNPNEVILEYSNDPNVNGGNKTGKTPKDVVKVFTYMTIIDKVTLEGAGSSTTAVPLTGAQFTLEKFIKDDNVTTTFSSDDTTLGRWVAIAKDNTPGSDLGGTRFIFKGLDDGKYRLTETETPAGYNTIENPIIFEVTAEHEADSTDPQLTALNGDQVVGTINLAADVAAGTLSTDVVNNAGSILPSTGGIGTTLFYVFGALLVIGAGVLLVVRRRMGETK